MIRLLFLSLAFLFLIPPVAFAEENISMIDEFFEKDITWNACEKILSGEEQIRYFEIQTLELSQEPEVIRDILGRFKKIESDMDNQSRDINTIGGHGSKSINDLYFFLKTNLWDVQSRMSEIDEWRYGSCFLEKIQMLEGMESYIYESFPSSHGAYNYAYQQTFQKEAFVASCYIKAYKENENFQENTSQECTTSFTQEIIPELKRVWGEIVKMFQADTYENIFSLNDNWRDIGKVVSNVSLDTFLNGGDMMSVDFYFSEDAQSSWADVMQSKILNELLVDIGLRSKNSVSIDTPKISSPNLEIVTTNNFPFEKIIQTSQQNEKMQLSYQQKQDLINAYSQTILFYQNPMQTKMEIDLALLQSDVITTKKHLKKVTSALEKVNNATNVKVP